MRSSGSKASTSSSARLAATTAGTPSILIGMAVSASALGSFRAGAGSVKVLPPGERTRNDPDHWDLAAQGSFRDGSLTLPVGFTFDITSSGLKCVMYNAFGSDVEALRALLDKRYGKPKKESDYGTARGAMRGVAIGLPDE